MHGQRLLGKMAILCFSVLVGSLFTAPAFGQVVSVGKPVTLTVARSLEAFLASREGQEPEEVQEPEVSEGQEGTEEAQVSEEGLASGIAQISVDTLELLGAYKAMDPIVVILYADSNFAYISYEDLAGALPAGLFSLDELPAADGMKEILFWESSDSARMLQQALAYLGYLGSKVDGVFGNGSVKAVQDFMAGEGQTVEAPIPVSVQLLVLERLSILLPEVDLQAPPQEPVGEGEVSEPGENPEGAPEEAGDPGEEPQDDALEKFALIRDQALFPLEGFAEENWELIFSQESGMGQILNTRLLEKVVESPAIERMWISGQWKVLLEAGPEGLKGTPVLDVTCKGAVRPYISKVSVYVGEEVVPLSAQNVFVGVEGKDVVESYRISFPQELMESIRRDEESMLRMDGRLKVRLPLGGRPARSALKALLTLF